MSMEAGEPGEGAGDPQPERAGYLASFIFVDEHQVSVQLFGERQGLTFPCPQPLQPGGKGLLWGVHAERQCSGPPSPLIATVLGIRRGLADARAGRPPYLYGVLLHRRLRREAVASSRAERCVTT